MERGCPVQKKKHQLGINLKFTMKEESFIIRDEINYAYASSWEGKVKKKPGGGKHAWLN